MGRAGQIVVEVLMSAFLAYSLGLGFLDAFPLSAFGVWGMILARDRAWWKALLEVTALVAWGLVIVAWRSQTPRFLTPPADVLGGLILWYSGLAVLGQRFPNRMVTPWLVAAALYFLPGEYFVSQYLALGGLLAFAAAFANRLLRS